MNKIAIYLNRHLTGNVFEKDSILEAYSSDRSMLKIKPRFVAIPESTSDIRKIVRFAAQLAEKKYILPISVRGSGLSKTGSDLTNGLVISTEKLNHVRELDAHDRLVHVQAGITLGKLNAVLAPHGLIIPIKANPNETIGALIANAPKDNYSKRYGGIINYVERAEFVLSSGDAIQTAKLNPKKLRQKIDQQDFEGEIYNKVESLYQKNQETIEATPLNNRIGYPALRYVKRNRGRIFDLLPVLYGSEGSLGVITEVILRAEVMPPRPHRLFLVANTLKSAQEFADTAQKLEPLSIEIYDTRIFKTVDDFGKKPDLLTRKFDQGYVVLVSFNDKPSKSRRKVRQLMGTLPKSAYAVMETIKNSLDFDDFSTSLDTYINESQKAERPNLLNDFSVPADELQDFEKDLKELEKTSKRKLAIFGCYSTGIYSVRPEFDMSKIDERRAALTLMRDFNLIVEDHKGSIAGGLPEGRLKPIVIYPELNANQKKIIKEIKKIFDKNNILSPNTKTNYDVRSAVRYLRTDSNNGIEF